MNKSKRMDEFRDKYVAIKTKRVNPDLREPEHGDLMTIVDPNWAAEIMNDIHELLDMVEKLKGDASFWENKYAEEIFSKNSKESTENQPVDKIITFNGPDKQLDKDEIEQLRQDVELSQEQLARESKVGPDVMKRVFNHVEGEGTHHEHLVIGCCKCGAALTSDHPPVCPLNPKSLDPTIDDETAKRINDEINKLRISTPPPFEGLTKMKSKLLTQTERHEIAPDSTFCDREPHDNLLKPRSLPSVEQQLGEAWYGIVLQIINVMYTMNDPIAQGQEIGKIFNKSTKPLLEDNEGLRQRNKELEGYISYVSSHSPTPISFGKWRMKHLESKKGDNKIN